MEQTFPHAVAIRGCTQEDAPALELYFTQVPFAGTGEPATPYIRAEISSSVGETLAQVSLTLIQIRRDPAKPGRIARAELIETKHQPVWLSGTIVLNEAAPGRRVSGRYDFTAPGGKRFGSDFTAGYSARTALCG